MRIPQHLFVIGAFVIMAIFSNNAQAANKTAHDFKFETLMGGDDMPLSDYAGKVVLIVNTASECGLTGQYEGLEALYQQYKDDGFVIIGVPSNDFGGQEPGEAKDIAKFCKLNYGVSFPMAAKSVVKGKNAHPFYKWAKQQLGFGTTPKWNFHKYLVGKDGTLIRAFSSVTSPTSGKIKKSIDAAIAQ